MNKTIKIKTIDLHAAGEPCRVIYEHFYDIPGETMYQKKCYLIENHEDIRRSLMLEPRGHANMFGSIITKPTSDDADAGVIFLTNSGYMDMCIHGSLCTSRAVVELGMKLKNKDRVVFDTVGGKVTAHLKYNENGVVCGAEIENVPSFIYNDKPIKVQVASIGEIEANIVFAGNFFVIVDGKQSEKLNVHTGNYDYLAHVGIEIRDYVNKYFRVVHPTKPELNIVNLAVIFNRKSENPKHVKNIVVFGDKQVDRSPCGTGTSGLMVYFNSIGELNVGQSFESESVIGSFFYGHLKEQKTVDGKLFSTPRVAGKPSVTGFCEFVLDPADEYQFGIPFIM